MSMTVAEVLAERNMLASQISQLVDAFQASTGCIVHSIPIHQGNGITVTTVEVKVQIP